jgi:hypothetical protein
MPAAVVPALLTTGVGVAAAGGVAAFTFAGMAGWAAIAASTAAYSALGYAASALAPKPSSNAGMAGHSVNTVTSAAPSAIIYGETRVGGIVFYQETTGSSNKYLHRCIALAGHEVNQIGTIYLNDEEITLDEDGLCTAPNQYAGKVLVIKKLGSDDQEAVDIEGSTRWTSDHRARGIAYIYVRLKFDADAFPNGVPTVTAKVQGKKVYDPDTQTTAFSSNPALCLRDYLISSGIAEEAEIDDDLFVAAASACDDPVSTVNGPESRYTCNGSFTSEVSPQDAINNLLASMGGMVWYSQGVWGCKAAVVDTAALVLDESDLRSKLSVATRNSRRDAFNKVTGIYKGAETNYYESSYPSVTSQEFVDVDGGLESSSELNLPFTNTATMAQRIAKISLYRNREQLKISGVFGLNALNCGVGDIVKITNERLGFEEKDFEVVEWSFAVTNELTLEVAMTLQEISANVFLPYADETAFESNNTTLLSPFYVPDVAITLSQQYRVANETVVNVLVVETTSSESAFIDAVEVQFKTNGETEYTVLGVGDLGKFEILNIDTPVVGQSEQITYEVRARAFNSLGVKGTFSSKTKIIEADTTGPQQPANFQHQLSGGSIFFKWDAVPDLDLSYYELYHSPSTTASFGDGSVVQVIAKIARPATSVTYPALSGTFFLEPYDKTGNSGTTASTVVSADELPALDITETDTENPTFGGTKTNTQVVSSELLLTSYATAPSSGTYEFDGYLDVTTNRTVRVSSNTTIERKHANAVSGEVNWDDIPDNWDTWPSNWDDWTDETLFFGDYNVTVYVMSTATDAGGGTPDWTGKAWTVATGESTGRWFKFKAELTSSTNNVTPLISVLQGIVEY